MAQFSFSSLARFFFELGVMKRQKRSGWLLAGVHDPESIAEHTARAALIGMVLADMEGADPERVASILIVHDIAEVRIGDQHKVAARYLRKKEAEHNAFSDQIAALPPSLQERFASYFRTFEERDTKEGIIAQDADWLEAGVTAREYELLGHTACKEWISNIEKALETDSAKQLIQEIKTGDPYTWWEGLKKMTYTKLPSQEDLPDKKA